MANKEAIAPNPTNQPQGESAIPSAPENKTPVGNPKKGKSIKPHLTLAEGWELAKQRGYSSAIASFKDWSARRADECESQFGLKRFPAQRGRRDQFLFADVWSDRS